MKKIEYVNGESIRNCIFLEDMGLNDKGLRVAKFKCHCGNIFVSKISNLKHGKRHSCGCIYLKTRSTCNFKHGQAINGKETPEYISWLAMRERCLNAKNHAYADYGGRGIKICKRWGSFANFFKDMGNRPSDQHSLDRYPDVNGDYKKSNCRWADRAQQADNKRNTIRIEYNGVLKTLKEWCVELKLPYKQTYKRVFIFMWSVEDAFTRPMGKPTRVLTFNGKSQSLTKWAKELGIRQNCLVNRLGVLGMSIQEALTPGNFHGRNQFNKN